MCGELGATEKIILVSIYLYVLNQDILVSLYNYPTSMLLQTPNVSSTSYISNALLAVSS